MPKAARVVAFRDAAKKQNSLPGERPAYCPTVSSGQGGTFVTEKNKESIREAKFRELEERIKAIVVQGKSLGLKKVELAKLLEIFYGEENE